MHNRMVRAFLQGKMNIGCVGSYKKTRFRSSSEWCVLSSFVSRAKRKINHLIKGKSEILSEISLENSFFDHI